MNLQLISICLNIKRAKLLIEVHFIKYFYLNILSIEVSYYTIVATSLSTII